MHINEVRKHQADKEHLMRHGYDRDYKSETSEDRERRGYTEHDGEYGLHKLNIKHKKSENNESIRQTDEYARDSGNDVYNI